MKGLFFTFIFSFCFGVEKQSVDFLFNGDLYVHEKRTPSELDSFLNSLRHQYRSHPVKKEDNLYDESEPETVLVMFYASWCSHCHKKAPIWSEIAESLRECLTIKFAAFECSMNTGRTSGGVSPTDSCRDHEIRAFPTFKVYKADSNSELSHVDPNQIPVVCETISPFKDTESLIKLLSSHGFLKEGFNPQCVTEGKKNVALSDSEIRQRLTFPERFPAGVWEIGATATLHDAAVGLVYSLKNWVFFGTQKLTKEANLDLRKILRLMFFAFPGGNAKLNILKYYMFLERNSDRELAIQEHKEFMELFTIYSGMDQIVEGQTVNFKSCTRVTCSIWTLLHLLTFGPYSQTEAFPDEIREQRFVVPPLIVMKGIREYVDQLFQCDYCQKHFGNCYDSCCGGRCKIVVAENVEGLQTWMWRLHNLVTLRTGAEKSLQSWNVASERQSSSPSAKPLVSFENQDVRFPPDQACPNCRIKMPGEKTKLLHEHVMKTHEVNNDFWDWHRDFDLEETLLFLRQYYFLEEWSTLQIEETLIFDGELFLKGEKNLGTEELYLLKKYYRNFMDELTSSKEERFKEVRNLAPITIVSGFGVFLAVVVLFSLLYRGRTSFKLVTYEKDVERKKERKL
eukprot:GHVP01037662.1.p1 GENE.GHVP01037662.1~~GHVP01037662.1.p1  ORF type:complete len:624 (+),score=99.03 GHVP01037662.1:192-2063(+)